MGERLGILGGTFDPPHLGHLLLAYGALEQLALDRVILIPARRQPLKAQAEITEPAHRLAMLRCLVDGEPRLAVDPLELDRPGLSFTVDTLRAYRAARPEADLVLLLGADAARTFAQWRAPDTVAALAHLVVCTRGEEAMPEAPPGIAWDQLVTRRVDISATEIRARVRAGLPIRGFVTEPVAAYIAAHGLYRPTS